MVILMDEIKLIIARNITDLRRKNNMTQAELAKLTGIRPSTICDLCNNNAEFLKIDFLNRILEVLKCDLNDILEYCDN